jgi:5-methylcytosine-specific restriction endonuclease McrA
MKNELLLTSSDERNYRALCNLVHDVRVRKSQNRRRSDQISSAMKLRLLTDQDFCCDHCGEEFVSNNDATADHIIQYSYGGEANYHNIRLVHHKCNLERARNYSITLVEQHFGPIDYTMIEKIPVVRF